MSDVNEVPHLQAAIEGFMPKVERRLHAWLQETLDSKPALTCVWNEDGVRTYKEVVFVGDSMVFDAKSVAKALNKAMHASDQVVGVLMQLYQTHNGCPVGEGIEF